MQVTEAVLNRLNHVVQQRASAYRSPFYLQGLGIEREPREFSLFSSAHFFPIHSFRPFTKARQNSQWVPSLLRTTNQLAIWDKAPTLPGDSGVMAAACTGCRSGLRWKAKAAWGALGGAGAMAAGLKGVGCLRLALPGLTRSRWSFAGERKAVSVDLGSR